LSTGKARPKVVESAGEPARLIPLSTPVESCVEREESLQIAVIESRRADEILIETCFFAVLSSPPPDTDRRSALEAWSTEAT
jgi:hypothetical protein